MPRIFALLFCLLLVVPAQASPIVYDGVTVIDGTGAAPKSGMAIVVSDGRIKAIVPSRQWRDALGRDASRARVVDLRGDYALPGLVDTHVHLATDPDPPFMRAQLRRFVYSGVTTVRDMAGDTRVLADFARGAKLNEIEAPDIYFAALMAGPQFFSDPRTVASAKGGVPGQVPWMRAIAPGTDLKIAVAEAHGTGATAIKIYADLPAELVREITAEAHRQHMLVWAHAAVFPASPMEVTEAGVDVASHACLLAYQASATMPPQYHHRPSVDAAAFANGTWALDPLFAAMKAHRTILDATLYVYQVMWKVPNAQPPPYCHLELAEQIAAAAHRAGIEISTGTDSDSDWNKPLPSLFDEIALLVRHAGFTPLEAIRAATLVGAKTVGQEKEFGSLAPGKRADMFFVAKDPLADIANLRSLVLTVKDAHEFWRAKFKPITKEEARNESGP